MIVKCKKCDISLTKNLVEFPDKSKLSEMDGEDYIPKGFYTISEGDYYSNTEGKIIINKTDLINAQNHPDISRLNGCCGLDGLDGINKICKNNHEIATEKTDCWIAHSTIFETDLISISDIWSD